MLGNILAVGLMSMGMGLSGVKDEPQMRANAQQEIILNDVTKENFVAFIENYMDITEPANDQEYVFENEEQITGIAYSLTTTGVYNETTQWKLMHINPHSNTQNQINLVGYVTNSVAYINQLCYDIQNDTLVKYTNNNPRLTAYPEDVGSLLTTGELPPQPMGQSIIGSIASGLGIIGALATTFLTGFSNLFYSSGALTPFAIFALVMLGVAVSFAVVKLVLNLIRSNTGA